MPNYKTWTHVHNELVNSAGAGLDSTALVKSFTKDLTQHYGHLININEVVEILGFKNKRALTAAVKRGTVELGVMRWQGTRVVPVAHIATHLAKLYLTALETPSKKKGGGK